MQQCLRNVRKPVRSGVREVIEGPVELQNYKSYTRDFGLYAE